MTSRLLSSTALVLALGLTACPGPQESGTDASTAAGKDAAVAPSDAAQAFIDASQTLTDAAQPSTDASRTDTDAARTGVDASLEALDAGATDAAAAGADAAVVQKDDAATAEPPDAAATATLGVISIADLWTVLQATPDGGDKGFLLINVHVPYQGNIPGTDANITYLDPAAIAAYVGTDLDRPVVVYCMSNYMSTIAGNDLVSRGYRAVRYLDGGMSAWKNAGHTLDP